MCGFKLHLRVSVIYKTLYETMGVSFLKKKKPSSTVNSVPISRVHPTILGTICQQKKAQQNICNPSQKLRSRYTSFISRMEYVFEGSCISPRWGLRWIWLERVM
jgi:hypothetical protein